MKTYRQRAIWGVLAAVGALAAGTAAAAEPGITQDSIKIGVLGPMTGPAALFGKSVFGVEAIYKDINDKGGIHGRKVVLVRDDTACDPSRGLAAIKKQVSQDQVFAINGEACSNVMMAMKPEVQRSGVPFVVMSAASPRISDPLAPNIFQPVATTDNVGRTMVDFAMSKPGTSKIAFVSHSDDWGKSNRDPAVEYLKTKYRIEPVANLAMERGSSNATPQILRLRSSGAEVVMLMMYPAEVAIFMRDAAKFGLKVPVLAPQSISLEDTRDRVGSVDAVRNLAVYYPYAHPFDSPEMKQYAQLINKYYPSERVENFSFLGMPGAYVMIKALQDIGPEPTRAKLIEALNNVRNFDTGVAAVPVSFSPEDHAGIKGGAMVTFKGDQIVIVKSRED